MNYPIYLRSLKTGLSRSISSKEEHDRFFENRDPRDWVLSRSDAS